MTPLFRNGLNKTDCPGYLLFPMDPTLSGFALGLLLAAAKVGAIGTVAFGIAWWRTRKKLRRLEAALPDPTSLAERLANLEQMADYSASQRWSGLSNHRTHSPVSSPHRPPKPAYQSLDSPPLCHNSN
jgi:hypothetical protein